MPSVTEEKAKEKWCPHVVASHTDPRTGFHNDEPTHGRKSHTCIGARCMAWRWAEDLRETKTTYAEIEKTPKAPAGEGWEPFGRAENMADGRTRRQWARLMPNRRGMCGLAGPLIELM